MSIYSSDFDGYSYTGNLTSLSTADTILLQVWAKMPSSSFGVARQFAYLSQVGTAPVPCLQLGVASTNHLQFKFQSGSLSAVDESTNASIFSTAADTWAHFAGILEGPQNGTSKIWRSYLNGILWDSGTYTSANSTVNLGQTAVGAGIDLSGDPDDKFAYLAVASVASVAAAASIISQTMTLVDPKTISGIDHCWPLLHNRDADVGGINLTFYGEQSFDAADMPQPFGTAMFTTQGFF